ncbi:MAG: DNA polymerase ligase N-terminal domain-containing protein [Phycisphaerae bacterium]|nr:DNA polymerase ligase N-terminal domain-containing protein [Phycisphaerae bacterium]
MWNDFVIQKHAHSENPVHWDLMLQCEDTLETYRLEIGPDELASQPCSAARIADHPLKFLTYEGPVNKGLGNVEIAEKGKYRVLQDEASKKQIEFDGCALKGVFTLQHIAAEKWQFQPQ